jgi:hypothetical protein
MIRSLSVRHAARLMLVLGLVGCAADAPPGGTAPLSREAMAAIQRYYESNAAEQNNACSGLIMNGVTRTNVVSERAETLVVDVTYKYLNYANRSDSRCRGIGNRRFTLRNDSGRFVVTDMTGERRLGLPAWRIW